MKQRFLLLLFPVFLLSSCFSKQDSNTSWTNSWANINTKITQTWTINKEEKKSLAPLWAKTQDIIKLQLKNWPDYILKLDCNKYEWDSKKYCDDQQKIQKQLKEEIAWEDALKKWNDYIKTFDCKTIKQEVWQKYCIEYKKAIQTQSANTNANIPKQALTTQSNSILNPEFKKFLELPKDKMLSYDCNKLKWTKSDNWMVIDYYMACKNRKISINFEWLKENELQNYDCIKQFSDKVELQICQNMKVNYYIQAIKKSWVNTVDCNSIFSDKVEKEACDNLSKIFFNTK